MADRRPSLLPYPRFWFHGTALIGAGLTAYNVLLSIIQVAPITQADLKWWLFGIGAVFSLCTWWALAYGNAARAFDAAEATERHAADMAATEQLQTVTKTEFEKLSATLGELTALVAKQGKLEEARAQQLLATAKSSMTNIVASSNISRAMLSGRIRLPADGPFRITGSAPGGIAESKTGVLQLKLPEEKAGPGEG